MKKTLFFVLTLSLVLSFNIATCFADNNIETTKTIEVVESSNGTEITIETISTSEIVKEEVLKTEKRTDVIARYEPIEKTFKYYGANSNRKKITVLALQVATHDIYVYYDWTETWECDPYGNKVKLISSTPRKIYSANQEYHSFPPTELYISDWDDGIGTQNASAFGHVTSSTTGTHSFSNSCSVW